MGLRIKFAFTVTSQCIDVIIYILSTHLNSLWLFTTIAIFNTEFLYYDVYFVIFFHINKYLTVKHLILKKIIDNAYF